MMILPFFYNALIYLYRSFLGTWAFGPRFNFIHQHILNTNMKKLFKTPQHWLLCIAFFALFSGCDDKKEKFTLNVRMEAKVDKFNPLLPSPGYARFVAARIFQTLGDLDPVTYELRPILLSSIPSERIVADGPHKGEIAYDFEINPDATWDNGTKVTVEDVIFTLKVMFHPEFPSKQWQDYYKAISSIESDAGNPQKFTVYFKEFYILSLESICQFPIYPAYQYDPQGRLSKVALADMMNPAKQVELTQNADLHAFIEEFTSPKFTTDHTFANGSGPYRISSYDNDNGLTLTKKEKWWGDKAKIWNDMMGAYPDKIVYKVVKSEQAIETMLRNKELDVVIDANPTYYKKWEADPFLKENYDFSHYWASRYSRLVFNLKNPNEPEVAEYAVRKALSQAIDYDEVINNIYLGMAKRSMSPVNPSKSYYVRDLPSMEKGFDAAKKTLADAGWADTNNDGTVDKAINGMRKELEISFLASTEIEVGKLLAELIVQNAQKIGIKVILEPLGIVEINKRTREGNFEMATYASAVFPGWPDLKQNYGKSNTPDRGGDNRGGFANDGFEALVAKLNAERDTNLRKQYIVEAQRIFNQDLPEIILFSSEYRMIVDRKSVV